MSKNDDMEASYLLALLMNGFRAGAYASIMNDETKDEKIIAAKLQGVTAAAAGISAAMQIIDPDLPQEVEDAFRNDALDAIDAGMEEALEELKKTQH